MENMLQSDKRTHGPSEEIFNFLSRPDVGLLFSNLTLVDKLTTLSCARETLNQGRQPHPVDENAILAFLVNILVADDNKFLLHITKELFVAVVTKSSVQNTSRFVEDLLLRLRAYPWKFYIAIEICCQLLSRHNPNCDQFMEKMGECLLSAANWVLGKSCSDSVKAVHSSTVFESMMTSTDVKGMVSLAGSEGVTSSARNQDVTSDAGAKGNTTCARIEEMMSSSGVESITSSACTKTSTSSASGDDITSSASTMTFTSSANSEGVTYSGIYNVTVDEDIHDDDVEEITFLSPIGDQGIVIHGEDHISKKEQDIANFATEQGSGETNRKADLGQHCLYQLFVMLTKIAKIVVVSTDACHARKLIHDILHTHRSSLQMFLFTDGIKHYVKKKLLKFLCVLFEQENAIDKHSVWHSSLLELAKNLMLTLDAAAIETVVWRNEESHFMGSEQQVRHHCTARFDKCQVQDWVLMSLTSAMLLSGAGKESEELWQSVISRMDNCIRQKLIEVDTSSHASPQWLHLPSVMFPWLPMVYGDQDDAWVEVMLLLLDMTGRSRECDPFTIQPHFYFLQFVSLTGFDHLILVDLLTSPETKFLGFFVRYLKYLLHSITPFLAWMKEFDTPTDANKSTVTSTLSESIPVTSTVSTSISAAPTVRKSILVSSMASNSSAFFREFSDGSIVINTPDITESQCITANLQSAFEGECITNKADGVDAMEVQKSGMRHGGNVDVTNMTQSVVVPGRGTGGLALLMGMYSDSEEDEEVLEDQPSQEGAEPDLSSFSKVCGKLDGSRGQTICDDNDSEAVEICYDGKRCNNIFKDSEGSDMKPGSDSDDVKLVNISGDNNVEPRIDICKGGLDSLDSAASEYDKLEEGNSVALDDSNSETDMSITEEMEERVFDKVLGMFVRVRLKLERLSRSQMLPYNPMPLLRVLNVVETQLEENA